MTKGSSRGLGTVSVVRYPERAMLALAGVVKKTYTIRNGRLETADEQLPLVEEPEFDLDDLGEMGELTDDTDLVAPKIATDVVLRGTAYSIEKTRQLLIGVGVGTHTRVLQVTGPRAARVGGDGVVSFSRAEPFQELALSYRHAYGGYDERAHDLWSPETPDEPRTVYVASDDEGNAEDRPLRLRGLFAYSRNTIGQGFFFDVERDRADGAPLPQIEDPQDLLSPERFFVPTVGAWIDAPIPGSLGWLQHTWYPRIVRLVGAMLEHDPPRRPIRESQLGDGADLTKLSDKREDGILPRGLTGAAPGMAVARLRGDEPVELRHLHRQHATLRFSLPGEQPRISLRPPGLRAFTPKAALQTVRIEPDHDRVSLTWCAMVPLMNNVHDDFVEETELGFEFVRL